MSLSHLAPGAIFAGEFRVIRTLGQGGMGAVYAVEQLSTGKERALKIMQRDLMTDDGMRKRFQQEALIAAKIDSEHVVEMIDAKVDLETGTPWLLMELLQGETLAQHMKSGARPVSEVAEIFEQLGHALGRAHAHGIVHRDLKPENIFLEAPRRRGIAFTVKVLDFGIAKVMAEALTRSTAPMGTALWMAPEQTEAARGVQPSTDVWALGLIAFHLLTGKLFWKSPYLENPSPLALIRELAFDPLPRVSERAKELGVALPTGFEQWFERCVNRDPDARHRDAGEAIAALAPLLGREPPPTVAVFTPAPKVSTDSMVSAPTLPAIVATNPAPEPRRRRAAVWAAAGLIVIGASLAIARQRSTGAAPAASTTLEDDERKLAAAFKLKEEGRAIAAHVEAMSLPKSSELRKDLRFRKIENAWAEQLLASAKSEANVVAKKAMLREILDSAADDLQRQEAADMVWAIEHPGAPSASAVFSAKPVDCTSYKGDYFAATKAMDSACVRAILFPRLEAGTISASEARYLKAACKSLGDASCETRAAAKM